jgi:hypothetical protein
MVIKSKKGELEGRREHFAAEIVFILDEEGQSILFLKYHGRKSI